MPSTSSPPSSPASPSGPSPLYIPPPRTNTFESSTYQSTSASHRAQPPPSSPQRTVSEPLSAGYGGYVPKALRFASFDQGAKKGGDVLKEREMKAQRRHSADDKKLKMNQHTECGRHGDEWLFGGWSKIWGKG